MMAGRLLPVLLGVNGQLNRLFRANFPFLALLGWLNACVNCPMGTSAGAAGFGSGFASSLAGFAGQSSFFLRSEGAP